MKILLVIDSLGSGGAQRLFAHLACELCHKGHEVDVFVYDNSNFYDEAFVAVGVRIIRAKRTGKGFSWGVLAELIKTYRLGYDRVFSAMHAPSFYAALASLISRNTVLTVCEFSSSVSKTSKIRKALFYVSTLIADKVICNSVSEVELMQRLPGRSSKLASVWNGYSINEFNYVSPSKLEVPTLLVVGRIAYPKNGVVLFQGLQLFAEKNGWCPRLLWAGRRDYDPLSIKMYEDMIKIVESRPELNDAIEFLGEVEGIEQLYHTVDGLAHFSLYEGLPNVICEAMLLGCPILASNVCDHPIVLGENGERGLLADPLSADSIRLCIENFINMSVEARAMMAQEARVFAAREFDIESMTEAYLHV